MSHHEAGHGGADETAGTGTTDSLVIPSRFRGPPGSGNGGYVCGRIAAYVDGPVTVTLRRPPPLATPMAVERDEEGSVRMHHGRTLIAEATSSPGGYRVNYRQCPRFPGRGGGPRCIRRANYRGTPRPSRCSVTHAAI